MDSNNDQVQEINANINLPHPLPVELRFPLNIDRSIEENINASIELAPEQEQSLPDLKIDVSLIKKKVDNEESERDETNSQEGNESQDENMVVKIMTNQQEENKEQ